MISLDRLEEIERGMNHAANQLASGLYSTNEDVVDIADALIDCVSELLEEVKRLQVLDDKPHKWVDSDLRDRCEHDNGFCMGQGKRSFESCKHHCTRRKLGWHVDGLPRKSRSEIDKERERG